MFVFSFVLVRAETNRVKPIQSEINLARPIQAETKVSDRSKRSQTVSNIDQQSNRDDTTQVPVDAKRDHLTAAGEQMLKRLITDLAAEA